MHFAHKNDKGIHSRGCINYALYDTCIFCSIILAGVTLTQANLPGLGGRSLKLLLKLKAC
jgi:hypothetical protein